MSHTFPQILITQATKEDLPEIRKLFSDTITSVNIRDYNKQQVMTWASVADHAEMWEDRLREQYFICARIDESVVGFGSLTPNGYLHFIFVHKDYQRQGIASALLSALITQAGIQKNSKMYAEVSITAKPFFERNGFYETKKNLKILKGVEFINYEMVKDLK
jgi:putative acetyltransferase